jgi:hypothetical protein
MLCRVASGFFFTYSMGDAMPVQELFWFADTGGVQRMESLNVKQIWFAYGLDDKAKLVEWNSDWDGDVRRNMLAVHTYDLAGTVYPTDTLFTEIMAAGHLPVAPAFCERDGQLFFAWISSTLEHEETLVDYRGRLIRYLPRTTVVGGEEGLDSDPASGYVEKPVLAALSGNRAVLGHFKYLVPNTELRFRALDARGQLMPQSHAQPLCGDQSISGISLLVHSETVYACYTSAFGANTDTLGAFFLGFPLSEVLAVREPRPESPSTFSLAAYPNPFNGGTRLRWELSRAGETELEIFDIAGRLAFSTPLGMQTAGSHELLWSAESLPSGLYVARLRSGSMHAAVKLLLIR